MVLFHHFLSCGSMLYILNNPVIQQNTTTLHISIFYSVVKYFIPPISLYTSILSGPAYIAHDAFITVFTFRLFGGTTKRCNLARVVTSNTRSGCTTVSVCCNYIIECLYGCCTIIISLYCCFRPIANACTTIDVVRGPLDGVATRFSRARTCFI